MKLRTMASLVLLIFLSTLTSCTHPQKRIVKEMKSFAKNRKYTDITRKHDPEKILEAGRKILADTREDFLKNTNRSWFIRFYYAIEDDPTIKESSFSYSSNEYELPKTIVDLNPPFMVIYDNYLRIEMLACLDDHCGFFIYRDDDIYNPMQEHMTEIMPGLWCY